MSGLINVRWGRAGSRSGPRPLRGRRGPNSSRTPRALPRVRPPTVGRWTSDAGPGRNRQSSPAQPLSWVVQTCMKRKLEREKREEVGAGRSRTRNRKQQLSADSKDSPGKIFFWGTLALPKHDAKNVHDQTANPNVWTINVGTLWWILGDRTK